MNELTKTDELEKPTTAAGQAGIALLGDTHYMCEMCGEINERGWTKEESLAEAKSNGFDPEENPDDYGIVCDDCYKKTPWGMADA